MQFLKKDSLGFIMVCNIEGQLGTKVVISALGMLALYMRFNGTGIWGGETTGMMFCIVTSYYFAPKVYISSKYWPSRDWPEHCKNCNYCCLTMS